MARRAKVETDSTLPKTRKRRKPMTPEQKAAAAERLALAREKRAKANPPKYTNIHHTVVALDEEHIMSMKNVQRWIKTQKELLSIAKSDVRRKVKGAEARVASHEGYIRNLHRYLRDGDYCDSFYGEHQQHRCKMVCRVMAYHPDGRPKRSVGIWYPDIGCTWTREMENE